MWFARSMVTDKLGTVASLNGQIDSRKLEDMHRAVLWAEKTMNRAYILDRPVAIYSGISLAPVLFEPATNCLPNYKLDPLARMLWHHPDLLRAPIDGRHFAGWLVPTIRAPSACTHRQCLGRCLVSHSKSLADRQTKEMSGV